MGQKSGGDFASASLEVVPWRQQWVILTYGGWKKGSFRKLLGWGDDPQWLYWSVNLGFGWYFIQTLPYVTVICCLVFFPHYGFPGGKESACHAGDTGLIPGSGSSPGEGNSHPLQYSCLGNPMDREAWWATVHGVTKSQTELSD